MNLIELEPAREHSLTKWWMASEAGDLMLCLEKAYQVALIEATDLQAKSQSDTDNAQFAQSAKEKLKVASDLQITIRTLKSFFPDGPFIAKIEL